MDSLTYAIALILFGISCLGIAARAEPPRPPGDSHPASAGPAAVPLPTDSDCWSRMPAAATGGGQPLPSWARAVATRLPRTAAAMLELDRAHRLKSPIDPVLRAKMRWVIAHANRCAYSEAYALADLKRAGADDATIARLTGDPNDWPQTDVEPLA